MKHRQVLLSVIVVVLVSSSLFVTVGVADSDVSIQLDGPSEAQAGETVSVEVRINAETAVYGVQFQVTSSLPVTGNVRQGQFLREGASSVVLVSDVSGTRIEYGETRTGAEDGVTGEGTVAIIDMTVPASTETNRIDLSFAAVKVSDPSGRSVETATQGTQIDVHEASGGGGGGGGGGGSNSNGAAEDTAETAVATQTAGERTVTGTAVASTDWPATVSSTVVQQFENKSRVRVIVSVDSSIALSTLADRLEANGAQQIERHDQLDSVSAVVTAETLRAVASDSAVTAVRYDSSAQSSESADGASGTPASAGEAETLAPATERTQAVTSPAVTGDTPATFRVPRGPAAAVGIGVVVTLLWWRLR
jgi:hypothetical protein